MLMLAATAKVATPGMDVDDVNAVCPHIQIVDMYQLLGDPGPIFLGIDHTRLARQMNEQSVARVEANRVIAVLVGGIFDLYRASPAFWRTINLPAVLKPMKIDTRLKDRTVESAPHREP